MEPFYYFFQHPWCRRHCGLATSRRKIDVFRTLKVVSGGSGGCLLFYRAADVDDVVGDDAERDPAVHSDEALVTAAPEAMAPFDHTDASLASGAPFLAVAEPALFLLALAFKAFGGAIGNADAFDAFRLRGGLVLGGVERGVRRHQTRRACQQRLMLLDGGNQQIRIIRAPIVDFVIGDDLVLCLLQFHHLAELVGLASLALANDFGRRLEQAEELAFTARVAAEDAGSGLFHHLPDADLISSRSRRRPS